MSAEKIVKAKAYLETLEQRMKSATPQKHAKSEAGYRQMLQIEYNKAKANLEALLDMPKAK